MSTQLSSLLVLHRLLLVLVINPSTHTLLDHMDIIPLPITAVAVTMSLVDIVVEMIITEVVVHQILTPDLLNHTRENLPRLTNLLRSVMQSLMRSYRGTKLSAAVLSQGLCRMQVQESMLVP